MVYVISVALRRSVSLFPCTTALKLHSIFTAFSAADVSSNVWLVSVVCLIREEAD